MDPRSRPPSWSGAPPRERPAAPAGQAGPLDGWETPCEHAPQTQICPLSLSNFFCPMPETRMRSSTDEKGPWASRSSTMARAVASPTPESAWSWSAVARLMFTSEPAPVCETAPPPGAAAARAFLRPRRDEHLLPVGKPSRKVHLARVGLGQKASRRLHGRRSRAGQDPRARRPPARPRSRRRERRGREPPSRRPRLPPRRPPPGQPPPLPRRSALWSPRRPVRASEALPQGR